MAACRRHEITEPSREATSPLVEASALALQLATTLGVTPRFATCHLSTCNPAKNGTYRTFTLLQDEYIFLDYNTLGIFAYQKAADALKRILPLGISHPLSHHLFCDAKAALEDVLKFNEILFSELDAAGFFNCVRPPFTGFDHLLESISFVYNNLTARQKNRNTFFADIIHVMIQTYPSWAVSN